MEPKFPSMKSTNIIVTAWTGKWILEFKNPPNMYF